MSKKNKLFKDYKRFYSFTGFKPITQLNPKIEITLTGEIRSTCPFTNLLFRKDEMGEWVRFFCKDGVFREILKAVLVSVVARNTSWPIKIYSKLTMYYMDGNVDNVHPSNTFWKPFPENIFWKYGIRYIPLESKYAITKSGDIYNVQLGTKLTWYYNRQGYLKTNISADVNLNNTRHKNRSINQHRAIMFAWDSYPKDAGWLSINHKDGFKANNLYSNLEWCTHTDNLNHAYEMNLRSTRGVKVRKYPEKIETIFKSIADAELQLKIKASTITDRCSLDGNKVYDGFQWKFIESNTPWNEDPDIFITKAKEITVRHVTTNEIIKFTTIEAAAKHFNLSRNGAKKRCKSKGKRIYSGYYWEFSETKN